MTQTTLKGGNFEHPQQLLRLSTMSPHPIPIRFFFIFLNLCGGFGLYPHYPRPYYY